ncbi:MFS transporter [Nocardia donostiensis]|uniref:MFS transporter n=1 Tax=Nocardia donostiensis TaxID=1538463 RepID=A0A1W0BBR8_9NOCA|nr:MFS transporter [Nocardia donostiensis]ONM49478.1 MFS transporter [Nocardia donostiensis]OQS19955.1 MFS transporter [Nocardia donostiensis]
MSIETAAPTRREWFGLIAISAGVALIVVDLTIVNVIVAPIINDLKITSTQAQWIQESYAIVFAALLLVAGRLCDLHGARRIFLTGLTVFAATSVLAAAAPDGELLIAARFLQGIGGALILPASLALVNTTFQGKARAQAFAVWGSTIGAAAAVGPLLGGWLADFSWRWAFGVNLPLVILIAAAVLSYLPASARIPGQVDIPDALLSMAGLGLLSFGLIEGRSHGWLLVTEPWRIAGFDWNAGPSPVLVAFAVAALALIVFWRRQVAASRAGVQPLLDVRLFGIGSFRRGNVVTLIIGIGEFGIIAVLPLWLQFTLGYTALQAGLALVPLAVGSFCASGASFSLAASVSALGQVRIGLVLEAIGLVLLGACAAVDSPWWPIALALFVYGIGVGFATAQVTNIVLADVPPVRAGQASGIQSTARELGSALGIALLTTVFFSLLESGLRERLTDAGVSDPDAHELSAAVTDSAGVMVPDLAADPATSAAAHAAGTAMTTGIAWSSYICAALLMAALAATLFVTPTRKPESSDPASEGASAEPGGATR